MSKSDKAIVEEYSDRVWNKKDLSAIDQLVHPDVMVHSLLGDYSGQDSLKKVVQSWLKGFPDLSVQNVATISENSLVAMHWMAKGTHKGEFKKQMPKDKPVSYAGVTLFHIKNGKIVEYWAYLDMQHLLNQIA